MEFPVSGVETPFWVPIAVGFIISYFCSMGGISGAFLILPFQISFLGFTSPAVSATNLVYNIVSVPSGMYGYFRERRMVWPLAAVVIAGALPGVFAGGWIRLVYLPNPDTFRYFFAWVLTYVGGRLVYDTIREAARSGSASPSSEDSPRIPDRGVETVTSGWHHLTFVFRGREYRTAVWSIALISLAVGVLGGICGLGGGAIMAPFYVAVLGLPVHAVAGASLMSTFVVSAGGILFYQFLAPLTRSEAAAAPDWLLGSLFGIGGMVGMYLGARSQRFVPARWIKLMLGFLVLFAAWRYFRG